MRCEGPPYSLITFWSGALIAIVAAAVGHLFTLWRDSINRGKAEETSKAARKRELVSYLVKWESEVDTPYRLGRYEGSVVSDFTHTRRHEFVGLAASMEKDYSGKTLETFRTRIKAIRDMTPAAIDSGDGQKALLKEIRDLLAFVRAN